MIEKESAEVEAASKIVREDEAVANAKAAESQALKDECESELAEALPALEAALAALNTLKVSRISWGLRCFSVCNMTRHFPYKQRCFVSITARWDII